MVSRVDVSTGLIHVWSTMETPWSDVFHACPIDVHLDLDLGDSEARLTIFHLPLTVPGGFLCCGRPHHPFGRASIISMCQGGVLCLPVFRPDGLRQVASDFMPQSVVFLQNVAQLFTSLPCYQKLSIVADQASNESQVQLTISVKSSWLSSVHSIGRADVGCVIYTTFHCAVEKVSKSESADWNIMFIENNFLVEQSLQIFLGKYSDYHFMLMPLKVQKWNKNKRNIH